MLSTETRHFGVIQYREDAVFEFPGGLPGFEDQQQFLLLERPDTRPLVFVQSLSTAGLCFIAVPVRVAKSDYQLCMPPEELASLDLRSKTISGAASAVPRSARSCWMSDSSARTWSS